LLQWKPRLRLVLLVLAVVAIALVLGWFDGATFMEW
jgi:hypothetical protein